MGQTRKVLDLNRTGVNHEMQQVYKQNVAVSHSDPGVMKVCEETIVSLSKSLKPEHAPELVDYGVHQETYGLRHMCFVCKDRPTNGEAGLFKCAGCKLVSYCSTKCQKKDWKRYHRQ